jgi:hypothetical protein
MCAFFRVCVQVEALRRADHPSKESYRLSLIKKLRKLSPMLQKREQAPKSGSNEEEKKFSIAKPENIDETPINTLLWDETKSGRHMASLLLKANEEVCFLLK